MDVNGTSDGDGGEVNAFAVIATGIGLRARGHYVVVLCRRPTRCLACGGFTSFFRFARRNKQ